MPELVDPLAQEIATTVERLFGIVVPTYRIGVLRDALAEIGGRGDAVTGLARVAAGGVDALRRLESAASIPETFLFRHAGHFEQLEEVARQRRERGLPTRVLSAGTSTGEEAWSAAAVLDAVEPPECGNHRVIGWELCQERVDHARHGRFNPWSVRNGLNGYDDSFEADGDDLLASENLRRMVQFERVNLLSTLPVIGPMDVVFFRNVSLYWKPETVRRVTMRLAELVADDGLLLVGPSDPVVVPGPQWQHEIVNGARIFRRRPSTPTVMASVPAELADVQLEPAPPAAQERRRSQTADQRSAGGPGDPISHRRANDALGAVADLADQGLYREALDLLDADPDAGQDHEVAVWGGILELNLDLVDQAVRSFRRAVYLNPERAAARHWLAIAYAAAGRSREAAIERRNAADIDQRTGDSQWLTT